MKFAHAILVIFIYALAMTGAFFLIWYCAGCSTSAVMRIATGDIASERMVLEINESRSEQYRTLDKRMETVEGKVLTAEELRKADTMRAAGRDAEGKIAGSVERAESQGDDLMAILTEVLKMATSTLGGAVVGRKLLQHKVEQAYLSPENTNRAIEDMGLVSKKAQKLKWASKRKTEQ